MSPQEEGQAQPRTPRPKFEHPPYDENYVLPKTKYGIRVNADHFADNNFLSRGQDAEDLRGDKWWIAVDKRRRQKQAVKDAKEKAARDSRELTQAEKDDYEAWRRKFEDEEAAIAAAKGGVTPKSGGGYK